MRVLMISHACHVAPYRRKLEELASFPDVELTLLVPPYWGSRRQARPFEGGYDRGYRLLVEAPLLNGHFHLHFYPRLGRHLDALRPDLVHIDEEPYDLVTFHAMRAARRRGAKTVFFTWQNIARRLPPPFGIFERYTLDRADAAIAGNGDAAEILRNKGFRAPIRVIPQFGVDPDLFSPEAGDTTQPSDDGFRIGYVGRLVGEKGLMVLMRALSKLPGQWRLQVVGEGPLEARIRRYARQLGIAERVTFSGSHQLEELPVQLRRMDALVLPSLTTPHWREQFGRVLVEAMACGVPVVGSDSGEIPKIIDDAGLVTREGDWQHLRDNLRVLMENPQLRRQLAQAGRRRVEREFTQRKIAQDTHRVYQEILGLDG